MLFIFLSPWKGGVCKFFSKLLSFNVPFFQMILREERQSKEHATAANIKLLHEYEILRNRLEESSVSFVIKEENKLVLDASSPSDPIDILSTSDNEIGLLLAEVCLYFLCLHLGFMAAFPKCSELHIVFSDRNSTYNLCSSQMLEILVIT